ncbi:MAG: methylmalonyl-CoA mutase family protein [Saprospiraceae bacterium]
MNLTNDFFAEFQPVSKEQWLERITRDLKGKPLQDLYWHLGPNLTVDPFGHADDWPVPPAPLFSQPIKWEINEDMGTAAPAEANRLALEALAFGAESVQFDLTGSDISGQVETVLSRIYLDYISVHFGGPGVANGPAAVLAAIANLAEEQGVPAKNLRGSLHNDPALAPLTDWRYLAELIQFARTALPGFRCLTVDGRSQNANPEHAVDELATLLGRGVQYLKQGAAHGLDLGQLAAQLQFNVTVGKSYFVEIARLRAFKLLWLNVLKAWGLEPSYPIVEVRFAPEAYSDDLYTNMIRATTMAMSAVLGGADRLTVLPYETGREVLAQYPRAFGRRIARNVQHLLKMESGFEQIADPAAGSFYIEKLTAQLAEKAWEKIGDFR